MSFVKRAAVLVLSAVLLCGAGIPASHAESLPLPGGGRGLGTEITQDGKGKVVEFTVQPYDKGVNVTMHFTSVASFGPGREEASLCLLPEDAAMPFDELAFDPTCVSVGDHQAVLKDVMLPVNDAISTRGNEEQHVQVPLDLSGDYVMALAVTRGAITSLWAYSQVHLNTTGVNGGKDTTLDKEGNEENKSDTERENKSDTEPEPKSDTEQEPKSDTEQEPKTVPARSAVPDQNQLVSELEGKVTAQASASVGGEVKIFVGTQFAGQEVEVYVFSEPTFLGKRLVDQEGNVSVTLPSGLTGDHRLAVYSNGELVGWNKIIIDNPAGSGFVEGTVSETPRLANTGSGSTDSLAFLAGLSMILGAVGLCVRRRTRRVVR